MAISVARAIELIVDWTHAEILALEAHLHVHPNRKPIEPPKPITEFIEPGRLAPVTITRMEAEAVAAHQPEPTPTPEAASGQEAQSPEVEAAVSESSGSPEPRDDGPSAEAADHAAATTDAAPPTGGDTGGEQHGVGDEEPKG